MSTDVHPALRERHQWMDWPTAAAYLGITQRQLRRAVEGRKIAFTRMGRDIRFTREQLDAFVEAATFSPEVQR